MHIDKKVRADKRKIRIRKCVIGTSGKPRLSIKFSNKHIYAQCIDDTKGATLFFLATNSKENRGSKSVVNVASTADFGHKFGQMAVAAGIKEVVFDRNGRKYHGCVKAFADSARESGLSF